MTSQVELIDELIREHPGTNEATARRALNSALAIFCDEARFYRDAYDITIESGRTAYNLGNRVLQVNRVVINSGVSDAPLVVPRLADPVQVARSTQAWQGGAVTGAPIVWYVLPSAGGTGEDLETQGYPDFHIGTIGTGALTALTTGVVVTLYRVALPTQLRDGTYSYDADGRIIKDVNGDATAAVAETDTDLVNIPAQFREAPLFLASSKLYMQRTDLPMPERLAMSREYRRMYGQLRKQARAWGERMQSPSIEPRAFYF